MDPLNGPCRDDASRIVPVRVDLDQGDRDAQLLAAAAAVLPAWEGAGAEAEVDVIGGGITNALFRLQAPERPPILVRIYGPKTEVVIDRERENRLFAHLSRVGQAPPYLGRFENGRVEGFLEGFRALEPHEMGQHAASTARKLAELHAIQWDDPPSTWDTLRRWMQLAQGLSFAGADAARHAALELSRYAAALEELEVRWHAEIVPSATSAGGMAAVAPVLAHNDLLSGNILVHEVTREIRFIDFEYGARAPAAFDVANHFCEYAGFDSDFDAHFPRRFERRQFCSHYLGPGLAEPDVEEFCDIVDFFVLPNHLWWGSWAVVQAAHSPIDFDFMEYARLRLVGFDLHQNGLP